MANNPFRAAYDLLVDELEHILNSKEIVPELSNQNVVLPLLRAIKICEFLEDKLEIPQNQRKSLGFLKTISNYYAISNLHVDSYYYIDETTLMDDIKYLQVFSSNTLHKDYKDLTPRSGAGQTVNQSKNVHTAHFDRSAKNNDSSASTTEPAVRGSNSNSSSSDGNYDYTRQENPYGNGPFGGMSNFFGGLFGYNYNAGDMGGSPEDQAAAMAASNRLNSEIFSGKIYIYKSKPKIIPIGKIIVGILCLLLICVVIIQVALSQSVAELKLDPGTALYNYLNQIYLNSLPVTGVLVENVMSSAEAASWFFAIFFILMFGWEAWIQLRPARNINDKYKMHIGYLLFVSIMVLIFFITNFTSPTIPRFMFANWGAWYATFHGTASYGIVTSLYAFTIIYVILLCLCIAIAIIAWIFKPKQDFQRLNDIYNRYFQEARSQFGGM